MRIGVSLILIAIGAILTFAVTATVGGIDIAVVGVILMIVGAIGLVISIVMMTSRRRTDVVTRTDGYAATHGAVAPGNSRTTYVEPADRDPRF